MLIRLLPEQVLKGWDLIRPMITATLPPSLRVNTGGMANILQSILMEQAQFWVSYRREGDGKPVFILLTSIMQDPVSGARYLLIYSMYGLVDLTPEDYISGLETIKDFAASEKCNEVIAYIEDDRFVHLLERMLGATKVSNIVRL